MSVKKYLAIDLGASSGRGIVGSFDGEKLTLRENCRFSNDPVNVNGRLYWDILRIFHEITGSIRQTVLDGDDIRSIGIDTWGVDYGLIDKSGRLMSNPVHYRDTRNAGIEEYAWKIIPFEELYGVTGIQSLNFNTIYQFCAELRDDKARFLGADKLLFIPDLLDYFLTEKMASEYTIMSTGAILDAEKRALSHDLMKKLGVPVSLFAPTVRPGNRLGRLSAQVLSEVGDVSAEVVNVASHDTASAVISVPNSGDNVLYISSGTWSLMGTKLKEPLISSKTREANYTNEGGFEDSIRFLKNIMGLWIIQESRRQWKREGKDYSFAELETMARASKPFACFIDPDDSSFSAPGDMPSRIADYCKKTGQYVPQTVGEIVRCIYESLAMKYRYTAEGIMRLTGIKPTCVNIVGGGSKDGLLNSMTADACGLQVVAGPVEATAIGNLIVQAISDGELSSAAEGTEIIMRSFDLRRFEPHDKELWDAAYEKFCSLIAD